MKNLKLSILGLLTLAGMAGTAGESQAWCLRDRMNRYSTYICCRPYNAFTPVCFGSITCNGCAPVMMQPPCMPTYGGWMPPGGGGACGPMGCCPNYTTGDGCQTGLPMPMDPMGGMMPQMMPQAPMGQHYAPQPYAAQPMPIQQQSHAYIPQAPMHNVGYQPGYQIPGYYVQPVSYYPQWPNQPVVPNYWYGR